MNVEIGKDGQIVRICVSDTYQGVDYFAVAEFNSEEKKAGIRRLFNSSTDIGSPPSKLTMHRVAIKLLDTLITLGCRMVSFASLPQFTAYHRELIQKYGWGIDEEFDLNHGVKFFRCVAKRMK